MKNNHFILVTLFFLAFSYGYSQVNSIKNGIIWRDTNGNRVQANGGNIIKHNNMFYMIGEDYSFSQNGYLGINLYASPDLMNWEFKNKIIDRNTNPDINAGIRFTERPGLLYNASTNQFVIWAHYEGSGYTVREAAVFYSNTIDGKYTFHKSFKPFGNESLDSNVFQEGNSAYFISEDRASGNLKLYKLTDDYLDVAEITAVITNNGALKEGPILFKKNNLYYIMCSGLTGWTPNQGTYTTSNSLTSGWTNWQNFGGKITYDTQPTAIFSVPGTSDTSFYYVGDRWQDPGNASAKNIISPLILNTNNKTLSLKYVHEFTINQNTGLWSLYDGNTYVPQNDWQLVSTSSEHPNFLAKNAFDGDENTIWHTNWNSSTATLPHEIIIDLKDKYEITGFVYIPRLDNDFNGIIRNFELYFSKNGIDWNMPVAAGSLSYWSEVNFQKTSANFVKLIARSEIMNNVNFTSAAEIKLMTNQTPVSKNEIIPYYNINNTGWKTGLQIDIEEGSNLVIGPQANIYGSYSWSGPNGFYSTNRTLNFNQITNTDFGKYQFNYLDDESIFQSKIFEINSKTLTTKNFTENSNKISLYPNPTSKKLHIANAKKSTSYSVYDFSGREIIKIQDKL
ncbi:hypothetical protein FDT66_02525 [Polaribacter aestuariivivens]|uniref:F5/8 type C domain-containing protein n=1 Tax=Polaribacter aestuariivivens TaxID=2304626 RepID=A0A5S3NEM2_9FLAO|nr:discoidin domain-containing protein [Polaribacter aestuariivivens]TMM32359.1 hypothetical protein FDT66_02525 [Polaribacter aestuariivivens]